MRVERGKSKGKECVRSRREVRWVCWRVAGGRWVRISCRSSGGRVRRVAMVLREMGFDVVEMCGLDNRGIGRAVRLD